MAVGRVIVIGHLSVLIQHNSKRPISDKLVRHTIKSLLDWPPLRNTDASVDDCRLLVNNDTNVEWDESADARETSRCY